jgi:hypothetical protein
MQLMHGKKDSRLQANSPVKADRGPGLRSTKSKGKFAQEQPHRSAYANPEYKAGDFEQYYMAKGEALKRR